MGALHTHNPVKTIPEDDPSQALYTRDVEGGIRSEARRDLNASGSDERMSIHLICRGDGWFAWKHTNNE